jgi:ribosomal subunit interface protein
VTTPVQITFRNLSPSDAISALIHERVEKLSKYCDRITSCSVAVEAPHSRHTKGDHFRVRVDMTVPGAELVADRDPAEHAENEDVYIAVRNAFRAAERELHDFTEKRRQRERAAP